MDPLVDLDDEDAVTGEAVEQHTQVDYDAECRGEQSCPPRLEYVLESRQDGPLPRTAQKPPPSVQPGFRSVRSKIS